MVKKVAWGIYGLMLIVAIGLVCFQLFQVMTGEVASYGYVPQANRGVAPSGQESGTAAETGTNSLDKIEFKIADTAVTNALKNYSSVDIKKFNGTKDSVTFRSQSGAIVCTITSDVSGLKSGDWVEPLVSQSNKPSGAGIECSVNRPREIATADVSKCADGTRFKGLSFALWGDSVAAGTCIKTNPRLWQTALKNANEQMALPALGLTQRVRIGEYACGDAGAELMCVHLTTGKGFVIKADSYYLIK